MADEKPKYVDRGDRYGKDLLTCPLCQGKVKRTPFMKGNSTKTLDNHMRTCEYKDEDEKAHYKEFGYWPGNTAIFREDPDNPNQVRPKKVKAPKAVPEHIKKTDADLDAKASKILKLKASGATRISIAKKMGVRDADIIRFFKRHGDKKMSDSLNDLLKAADSMLDEGKAEVHGKKGDDYDPFHPSDKKQVAAFKAYAHAASDEIKSHPPKEAQAAEKGYQQGVQHGIAHGAKAAGSFATNVTIAHAVGGVGYHVAKKAVRKIKAMRAAKAAPKTEAVSKKLVRGSIYAAAAGLGAVQSHIASKREDARVEAEVKRRLADHKKHKQQHEGKIDKLTPEQLEKLRRSHARQCDLHYMAGEDKDAEHHDQMAKALADKIAQAGKKEPKKESVDEGFTKAVGHRVAGRWHRYKSDSTWRKARESHTLTGHDTLMQKARGEQDKAQASRKAAGAEWDKGVANVKDKAAKVKAYLKKRLGRKTEAKIDEMSSSDVERVPNIHAYRRAFEQAKKHSSENAGKAVKYKFQRDVAVAGSLVPAAYEVGKRVIKKLRGRKPKPKPKKLGEDGAGSGGAGAGAGGSSAGASSGPASSGGSIAPGIMGLPPTYRPKARAKFLKAIEPTIQKNRPNGKAPTEVDPKSILAMKESDATLHARHQQANDDVYAHQQNHRLRRDVKVMRHIANNAIDKQSQAEKKAKHAAKAAHFNNEVAAAHHVAHMKEKSYHKDTQAKLDKTTKHRNLAVGGLGAVAAFHVGKVILRKRKAAKAARTQPQSMPKAESSSDGTALNEIGFGGSGPGALADAPAPPDAPLQKKAKKKPITIQPVAEARGGRKFSQAVYRPGDNHFSTSGKIQEVFKALLDKGHLSKAEVLEITNGTAIHTLVTVGYVDRVKDRSPKALAVYYPTDKGKAAWEAFKRSEAFTKALKKGLRELKNKGEKLDEIALPEKDRRNRPFEERVIKQLKVAFNDVGGESLAHGRLAKIAKENGLSRLYGTSQMDITGDELWSWSPNDALEVGIHIWFAATNHGYILSLHQEENGDVISYYWILPYGRVRLHLEAQIDEISLPPSKAPTGSEGSGFPRDHDLELKIRSRLERAFSGKPQEAGVMDRLRDITNEYGFRRFYNSPYIKEQEGLDIWFTSPEFEYEVSFQATEMGYIIYYSASEGHSIVAWLKPYHSFN